MNKLGVLDKGLFSDPYSTSYSQFLQVNQQVNQKVKSLVYYCFEKKDEALIDIDFFLRAAVVEDPHKYSLKLRQNGIYQTIFFGFALFFFILSSIIFFKTTNFTCGLYFGECSLIKEYINGFCLLLGVGSFLIGLIIKPDQEAFRSLFGKIEMKLEGPTKKLITQVNRVFEITL